MGVPTGMPIESQLSGALRSSLCHLQRLQSSACDPRKLGRLHLATLRSHVCSDSAHFTPTTMKKALSSQEQTAMRIISLVLFGKPSATL